jgi:uncharacterized protein YodC (DUF2158 family)
MTAKYKIGDIVQLKSGGPEMTVTAVLDDKTFEFDVIPGCDHIPAVSATWFNGKKMDHGRFPIDALIIVKQETTKPLKK